MQGRYQIWRSRAISTGIARYRMVYFVADVFMAGVKEGMATAIDIALGKGKRGKPGKADAKDKAQPEPSRSAGSGSGSGSASAVHDRAAIQQKSQV